jgi:hypothetical protein
MEAVFTGSIAMLFTIVTRTFVAISGDIRTTGAAIEACAATAALLRVVVHLLPQDDPAPSAALVMAVTHGAFLRAANPAWAAGIADPAEVDSTEEVVAAAEAAGEAAISRLAR